MHWLTPVRYMIRAVCTEGGLENSLYSDHVQECLHLRTYDMIVRRLPNNSFKHRPQLANKRAACGRCGGAYRKECYLSSHAHDRHSRNTPHLTAALDSLVAWQGPLSLHRPISYTGWVSPPSST